MSDVRPSPTNHRSIDPGADSSAELSGSLPARGAREWIETHLQEQRCESLLSSLRREISPERVFDFLLDDSAAIRASAFLAMKPWLQDPEFCGAIKQRLCSSDSAVKEAVLRALSGVPPVPHLNLKEIFSELLQDAASGVRHETARLICYQYPQETPLLLQLQPSESATSLLPFLCLSENPQTLTELLKILDYRGGAVPDLLGMLVTPQWLGEQPLPFAEPLMRQFGYIGPDEICTPVMQALLRTGFHFVNSELHDTPELHRLKDQLNAALDPYTQPELRLEARHNFCHLDPVEQATFLSETRAFDRANIKAFKEQNPFNPKWGLDNKPAQYLLKNSRVCEQLLLRDGLERAEVMKIPKACVGDFLLDWGTMNLMVDPLQHREAVVFLSAKWHAVKVLPEDFHEEILQGAAFPVIQDQDCPALKHVLLGPILQPRSYVSESLSPGGASVARVAEYLKIRGVHDYLVECERLLAAHLPPIGVELQVLYPEEGFHLSLPWKQVLRYFGINSPRRPVFGGIVEASFRPACTFHSPALGLALLFQCGLFPWSQESAIHISLQGDLGPDVRYILFMQEFLRESHGPPKRPKDPRRRMAKLMSKGFVCRNSDTEPCGAGEAPPCRTEFRGFRIWVGPTPGGARVRTGFLDDLAAVHLLGGALASKDPALQKVWKGYAAAVEDFAGSFASPAVRELLFSNWYEATGDQDIDPAAVLPIVTARERAHAALPRGEAFNEVRNRAAAIRNEFSTQVWQALGIPAQPRRDGLGILKLAGDVPLLAPEQVLKRVENNFMHFLHADNLLRRN